MRWYNAAAAVCATIIFTAGTGAATEVDVPRLGVSKFGTSRFGVSNLPDFTISTAVVGGNGTISCESPVSQGGTSTCNITPDAGYHLASLTDNDADKLSAFTQSSYVIYSITAGHFVSGTFSSSPVPGICGSSNGGTYTAIPGTNLCTSGTSSTVTGTGPWSWTCDGLSGGIPSTCFADTAFKIKMLASGTTHLTIQDAYNKAAEGETVLAQQITFTENLYCNRLVQVKLLGGRDSNYGATMGFTAIQGTLTIQKGSMEISGFIIK